MSLFSKHDLIKKMNVLSIFRSNIAIKFQQISQADITSKLTEIKRLSKRFLRNRKHIRRTGCKIRWNIQATLRLSATPSATSENGGGLQDHKSAYQHVWMHYIRFMTIKATLRVNHSFHNWEKNGKRIWHKLTLC